MFDLLMLIFAILIQEMKNYIIQTERLGLRNYEWSDVDAMTELCQDERVMEHFPKTLKKEEVKTYIERLRAHFEEHGFCYFAADLLETGEFIGFIGMMKQNYLDYPAEFTDIGWRLKPAVWGRGLAPEGARACVAFAFQKLKLNEVYAVCPEQNDNSERVMKKIGMDYFLTFQHPALDDYPHLQTCKMYRIKKS